ncbi:MAG TPA: xanthine dehydrogenase family protein molybdopterin-binding subunit [Chitinophagaceae bacterium]|nr:xanthine dehydrogenase family protein molybdopterin-binding subunit [Chitinophagaceae bacterium]
MSNYPPYIYEAEDPIDRVDGKAKVTGAAKYSAEYSIPNLAYGILVGSTIAKGAITALDTKNAERSPGVLSVITYQNAPKVPAYHQAQNANTPIGPTWSGGLKIFYNDRVHFYGQPVALVIADTLERAQQAASLVKVQYAKEEHQTDLTANLAAAVAPRNARLAEYKRGEGDVYKSAPVFIEGEYIMPMEVHLPMELHSTIAIWEGDDKVTVYDKTQGVKSTQRSIMQAYGLKEENVKVNSQFVGGGFGSALRTWPHVIAALMGAQKTGRPLKLVLHREQMFTHVGYRPYTIQKVGLGASRDGKLTGITHEAWSQTSAYEEFTEGTVNMSRFMYACPNVFTRYKIAALNLSTPTWMRGPGEATGSFALESAIDELAYALDLDPIELRLRNYAETDPERNRPFSSKFLKECYQMGADRIGWWNRNRKPRSMQENGWLVGYGMSSGVFGAFRSPATVLARLMADGRLVVQSAVSDSGPGTATAMVKLASDAMGLPTNKVTFQLGDSSLPPGPTQGGSATMSSLGSAVHDACTALQQKLGDLATKEGAYFAGAKKEDLVFKEGSISLADNSKKISYTDFLQQSGLPSVEVTQESRANAQAQQYSMYSFSVHFSKVHVHPATGVVKVKQVVTVADAGKIVSEKTAASQMIGGVVGGIGMALTEEAVIDHRYGRIINNNFADYHVPVHADCPHIEALFVNKPDPIINPMGSKGMGEIALIGYAASVANAVYHATGKRIRELPITPDKVM